MWFQYYLTGSVVRRFPSLECILSHLVYWCAPMYPQPKILLMCGDIHPCLLFSNTSPESLFSCFTKRRDAILKYLDFCITQGRELAKQVALQTLCLGIRPICNMCRGVTLLAQLT